MAKLATKNLNTVSTKKLDATDRKRLIEEIINYHEPAFELLDIEQATQFYPKVSFMWSDEPHISLFKKELSEPYFYIELVNEDYTPKDSARSLYRFRGSPECINEYFGKKEMGTFGEYFRYFVPLHDFEKVDLKELLGQNIEPVQSFEIKKEFDLKPMVFEETYDDEEETDALMSKLTIRDHAAIQWKLPVSNKKWLNNLINKINKV